MEMLPDTEGLGYYFRTSGIGLSGRAPGTRSGRCIGTEWNSWHQRSQSHSGSGLVPHMFLVHNPLGKPIQPSHRLSNHKTIIYYQSCGIMLNLQRFVLF